MSGWRVFKALFSSRLAYGHRFICLMNEQRNEQSQEFHVDGLTLPSISDAPGYLHPKFQKERRSIKMPLSIKVNEVLAFRKYVQYPEPVVKLWYGHSIQIPKCPTFTFL